ncbi:MAG: cysteine synthase A [candidate division WOR-3 bacterium]|nr:MAG: cysteine synthase A [candidate division WOR-3 bacterium]
MNRPVESVLELIGSTPMVNLKRLSRDIPAEIWGKLEFFNPSGSVKDRIALKMLEEAEKRNKISKGAVIIEPTSGNTGISLALVCALKGYTMIAVMPEAVSKERRMIVELLGGKVELIKCVDMKKGVTKDDMERVVARAEELATMHPNSFIPNQFTNEDNPKAHAETTATEILEQTEGRFHAFVAACGTGGTFTGVARILKEKLPEIRRVCVEPYGSAVMSGCEPGHHKIQGIGEGFIPEVMDVELAHEISKVSDDEAIATTRRLWKEEGIMAGFSSGANVFASLQLGKKMKRGEVIVTIIPDTGLRYFSVEEFRH